MMSIIGLIWLGMLAQPLVIFNAYAKTAIDVNLEEEKSSQGTVPNFCTMEPDFGGPCLASIHMYYFDAGSKTCKEFRYAGCGGNDNRFWTKEKCLNTCSN